jgi:hypothetical protein
VISSLLTVSGNALKRPEISAGEACGIWNCSSLALD